MAIAQRLLVTLNRRGVASRNWTTVADHLAAERAARSEISVFEANREVNDLAGVRLASHCLARVLRFQGRQREAVELLSAGLNDPENSGLPMMMSELLLDLGRTTEAVDLLCQVVERNEEIGHAHFMLAKFDQERAAQHQQQLTHLLSEANGRNEEKAALHCAIGVHLDRERQYAEALKYFLAAGELKREHLDKMGAPDVLFDVNELKSTFNAAFFSARQGWGTQDCTPVFVVGFSGIHVT